MFPTAKDTEKDLITIIGREEAVEAAKEELLKKIQDLVSFLYSIKNFTVCIMDYTNYNLAYSSTRYKDNTTGSRRQSLAHGHYVINKQR